METSEFLLCHEGCEVCMEEDQQLCPLHGTLRVMRDSPVPSLARLTLPSCLTLGDFASSHGQESCGVFAATPLEPMTRFGPLVAPLLEKHSATDAKHLPGYDLTKEAVCNWMMFVRPAHCLEEQNLNSVKACNQIYYVSTKAIRDGEELRVWYAPWYAQKHDLPTLPCSSTGHQREPHSMNEDLLCQNASEDGLNAHTEESQDCGLQASKSDVLLNDSLSQSDQRIRKHPRRTTTESPVGNPDSVSENRSSSVQSSNGLRSRSGRKLRPNSKYLYSDSDFVDTENASQKQKRVKMSRTVLSARKSPVFQRKARQGSPVLHSKGISVPMQSALDVLISAMEQKQNEVQDPSSEPAGHATCTDSQEGVSDTRPSRVKTTKKSRKYKCQHCGENFSGQEVWRTHEAAHTGVAPYVCQVEGCRKGFSSRFKHWRHQLTHQVPHSKQCPHCGKCFHRADHLKKHVETHNVFREMFTCDRCGNEYKSKESFTYHMAVHRAQEDDPLTCTLCPAHFSSREELISHVKASHNKYKGTADAPKSFNCPTCRKSFTTKKDMHRHTLVHSNVRNFLCEYCPQSFGRRDHLRRHLHNHHKAELANTGNQEARHTCELCHRGFHLEEHLALHVRSAHSQSARKESEASSKGTDPFKRSKGQIDLQPSSTAKVFVFEVQSLEAMDSGCSDWNGSAVASCTQTTPDSTLTQASASSTRRTKEPASQFSLLAELQGDAAYGIKEDLEQTHLQEQQVRQVEHKMHQQQLQQQVQSKPQQHLVPVSTAISGQALCNRTVTGFHQQKQSAVTLVTEYDMTSNMAPSNSPLDHFQQVLSGSSQPYGNRKYEDSMSQVLNIESDVIFIDSVISGSQEKSSQNLSGSPATKVFHVLSNVQAPATLLPCGSSLGNTADATCVDSEPNHEKDSSMPGRMGLPTLQATAGMGDSGSAVDVTPGRMASGSSAVLPSTSDLLHLPSATFVTAEGNPTASAASAVGLSGPKSSFTNQGVLISSARHPIAETEELIASFMFSNACEEGTLVVPYSGMWSQQLSSSVQTGPSFAQASGQNSSTKFPSSAPVITPTFSQSANASKLFPRAFPVHSSRETCMKSVIPQRQQPLLSDRIAAHQRQELNPVSEFAAISQKKSENVLPSSDVSRCHFPSDISLQNADAALNSSMQTDLKSIASTSTISHIPSSHHALGYPLAAAAATATCSSVDSSGCMLQSVTLQSLAANSPGAGGQTFVSASLPKWALAVSQGPSDHCYASPDGTKQSLNASNTQ